jgi:hypothetical protein
MAAYMAANGILQGVKDVPEWLGWVVWIVFLVATPFYMWMVKRQNEPPRPWWQSFIFAPLSFVAWTMTLGSAGPWGAIEIAALLGSVSVIVLGAVIFPLVSMAIAKATA